MKVKLKKMISQFFSTEEELKGDGKLGKGIYYMNRFSLLCHFLLSCFVVFIVEWISRRSFLSSCNFVNGHTWAFFYNAFLVFCSYTFAYLFRRRFFSRIIISGFWLFLGIVNGCILSNRVTPFGYTDIKCIPELFAMNNTSYFTAQQAAIVVAGIGAFVAMCIFMFVKGPKYKGKRHFVVVPVAMLLLMGIGIPITTQAAQSNHVVATYFSNIAQGYENYGFIYGFSCSVVDRGMSKPENYSSETIEKLMKKVEKKAKETEVSKKKQPNIICVLLESFCDPDEIKFLKVNKDPIPTFHKLEKEFTTGYLKVPVVGAGTANSEFEILTGMSMGYFGTGEYPYKTILKKTDCESVASDLSKIGYGTHVVHNNGGNFYSRVNAFSMFGFDSFTSKELMDIKEYTPNKSWATDGILVGENTKAMDLTKDQADFSYIITVGTHGDYPKTPVIENPTYVASGDETEEENNQWTYYVNQLNEVDTFMADLIASLEKRDEDTVVVMFGDHLPTLGLEDKDMVSNDIYKTKYVTWNNFGLEKKDADLYAYQLMADTLDRVGIHEGTIMKYHQTMMNKKNQKSYKRGLEELQYDILYGKKYCYNGEDAYPASNIEMGVEDVKITSVVKGKDGKRIFLNGENFTKWSKVYVDGDKIGTQFINNHLIAIDAEDIESGDQLVVNVLGSSDTIFRSSNTVTYTDQVVDQVEYEHEDPTGQPTGELTEKK